MRYRVLGLSLLLLAACTPSGGDEPEIGTFTNSLSQDFDDEAESNGTSGTATALQFDANGATVVRANIFPNPDEDYFSFTAQAGDRIYAATMTAFFRECQRRQHPDVAGYRRHHGHRD